MEEFIVNINANRFEVPWEFCRNYSKKFYANDVIIFKINNKLVMGTINVSKDKNSFRTRIRVPNYFFDSGFIGNNKIKILQHIQEQTRLPGYKDILIKVKERFYVDLYKIIPNRDSYNTPIRIVEYNKKLYLFKPFTEKIVSIKRFVDYYKLLEILGLYQGEGIRILKNYGKLQFANSKVEIINKFLNFFEELGLKRNGWKAFIGLTGHINTKREQEAITYWSAKIRVPKDNFRRGTHTKTFGNLHTRHGTVAIVFDSTSLAHCFVGILKNIDRILKDEKSLWFFMNGLLESDGSVGVKKDGNLSDLFIAYDLIEEALFYKKFIEEKLNIHTKIYKKTRAIYLLKDKKTNNKWWTWYRLVKNNCFRDHLDRKNKLIKGFLNHKETRMIYKYLSKFRIKQGIAIGFFLKLIGYKSRSSLKSTIGKLEKYDFINAKRIKNYYLYNLTTGGKEFLNIYRSLNSSYQNNKLF